MYPATVVPPRVKVQLPMKFVPFTVMPLLSCEPAATCVGLIDVTEGTGLGVPPPPPPAPLLAPPQLGNVSEIANSINRTEIPRLRGFEKPMKHVPSRIIPTVDSQAAPNFA